MKTSPPTPEASNSSTPILEVRDLHVHFTPTRSGWFSPRRKKIKAVNGVSLSVSRGEVLGIVGESGCGKSTLARSIVNLNEVTSGKIFFHGNEITGMSLQGLSSFRKEMQMVFQERRNIQMVFQDPYASLNARMTVGSIIAEPLQILRNRKVMNIDNAGIEKRVDELLDQVGLRNTYKKRFPHEFSGGQRQRIGIARAIAGYPQLVIADEPVSALDVCVQAQILNLMRNLQKNLGLTYLFIAHDLAVVNYISDRIAVMYLGQVVEIGHADMVYRDPAHPYTHMLLNSIMHPNPDDAKDNSHLVKGEAEEGMNSGCPFYSRCPKRMDHCRDHKPEFYPVGHSRLGASPSEQAPLAPLAGKREVACFLYSE